MSEGRLGYHVLYKIYGATAPKQPSSLIAALVSAEAPLKAMMWSARRNEWIYAPAIAASRLYDHQNMDSHDPVDRSTAEKIAREELGTELPSEAELRRMCEEGHKTGNVWGPPRPNSSESELDRPPTAT